MMNKDNAETTLAVSLTEAVKTGSIQVRVSDNQDPPQPIPGAQVQALDGTTVVDQGTTGTNGEATLEISFNDVALFATKSIRVVATRDSFTSSEQTVTTIAVATIDVNLELTPQ